MSKTSISSRALMGPALVSLLALSASLAACGGGSGGGTRLQGNAGTSPTGQVQGTAGGTGTAGTTAAGTAGVTASGTAGTTGSGTAGTMAAGPAVCMNYCTKIMAACTGTNQQYADMANCMKVCSYMPAGSPTDTTGVDSVGCRTYEATLAATDKNQCLGAGPLSDGKCGNDCNTFCTVATQYCSAASGYTGTPPYKSNDDCLNLCGQMGRQLDPTMAGTYNSMYMPGTTPETKDTVECRAYHLFINALMSPAAQTMHCPHAANVSAVCGMGVTPIDTGDAGGGSTGDGGTVSYDGGSNIVNANNWNETMYPPAKRKMLLRDEGDPHLVMIDLSKPAAMIQVWKTVAGGPWARAAQLIGNNQILGGRNDGYEVFDYTTGMITKTVNNFGNTQSAYRMATGETMLTRSGTILTFLDKTDKMTHQISYPGYGYVRVARPTRNGTFLVPSDTTLFEGDATGKVLWTAHGAEWGHIWEPLLLGPPVGAGKWNNGDTLLCTAFGSSCDVVDQKTHMVTFRFGTKQMPMAATVKPNFFSEYEILPNGNIFTANWQGHGGGNGNSGLQVLEFDPTGALVWYWKQDPTIFSSIQGVQAMDGKDPMKLWVEETSTNSTWQPMTPP
jgi:hypothetical protein